MRFWHKEERFTHAVTGIHVKNVRADVPEFCREYTVKLDNRCAIKVEMRTVYGNRWSSGELRQPNGKLVWFEPNRIADKILDPLLVPLVQGFVDEAKRLDAEYVSSDPSEIVDRKGVKWRRVD